MNARVLFVKVAISSVLLQHHPLSQVHASNSNVARTENSRYLSSAAYEFANNQVKLPVFSLLAGDAETLALHGVGNRKSDEVEEKFHEQNFQVLNEMRNLANNRVVILHFVGYVDFLVKFGANSSFRV